MTEKDKEFKRMVEKEQKQLDTEKGIVHAEDVDKKIVGRQPQTIKDDTLVDNKKLTTQ